jgi:DNA mismatch repair protein MutS2
VQGLLKKLDWNKLLTYLEKFTYSEFSKELCRGLTPEFSYKKVLSLQEKTRFLWNLLEKGQKIELPSLKSLNSLFEKAYKRGLFLPIDLIELKKWFLILKKLVPLVKDSVFHSLTILYEEIAYLESQLDRVLDYERGEIRDKASYNLFVIRKRIKEAQELLFSKLEKIREHFYKKGYLQENLFTQREGRYVLPVKIEYKNKVKGILHEVSQSGATAFIEPVGIIALSNEIEELKYKEQREIAKILKELSAEFFTKSYEFSQIEELYADFEISLAKAKLGRTYRGVFPELKEKGILKIFSGIHPLLILKDREETSNKPVYNDFIVEEGLLISGPNLGGKTVSLKTIGLLTLMAQSGFLIPAKFAEIPVFSKIFVDMGDDQDILQGESSFSSHLKSLKEILDKADSQSLVLLDEPGKGTNPEEGVALVAAIIEELLNRNSKIVITTHSQFLKTLALKIKKIKIATMEYDLQTREPTHRLVYGVWGESLAFDLAKRIGFPEKILKRAFEYLKNKEYWEWYKVLEEEINRVRELKEELNQKKKELEEERAKLEREKEELRERYYKKLETQIVLWNQEFKNFLEQIKEKDSSRKKLLDQFGKFVDRILEDAVVEEEKREIKKGDIVEVLPFKKEGEVLKVKEKTVEVKLGNLKIEVPKENISRIISRASERGSSDFKISTQSISLKESMEKKDQKERVKLLGLTVDEALAEVEKVLNRAFLSGVKKVYLVHGHGSGRLREAIREYLKTHPLVNRFEFAEPFEGGTGVTVVYLEEKN